MDISPLRDSPAFRRLWAGSLLSTFGSQITGFALALQVFRLTDSSLAVGGVFMAMAIPSIILGLLGGAVASLTSPAVSAVSGGLAVVLGAAIIGVTMPTFLRFASKASETAAAKTPEAAGQALR